MIDKEARKQIEVIAKDIGFHNDYYNSNEPAEPAKFPEYVPWVAFKGIKEQLDHLRTESLTELRKELDAVKKYLDIEYIECDPVHAMRKKKKT